MARSITRFMTRRRFLLLLLALLVLLSLAGAWYARVAWEEWRQLNNIRNVQWQGVEVSLSGVQVKRFSLSQVRDGQPYVVEGEALSLGWNWHWHGPMPDVVQVERLTVDIPAWPGPGEQDGSSSGVAGALPGDAPAWLPDTIKIDQLVATLPDGIRSIGDFTVTGLQSRDGWEITTNTMQVEAPIAGMTLAGWKLYGGQANLMFAGKANERSATLDFKGGTYLELDGVDAPDDIATLDKIRVDLVGTELTTSHSLQTMALDKLVLEGPLLVEAAAIQHPQLRPQPWRLDGQVKASLNRLAIDGRLSPDVGIGADIAFRFPFEGIPELDVEITAAGENGSRALADTFTAWPEELDIGEGSMNTTLGLRFPSEGLQAQGDIVFDGLGGVFDRTAWNGLDGNIAIGLSGEQLDVQTSDLAADSVNPGIALGNIRVAARYRSTIRELAAGSLELNKASAELLGGIVRIEPGEWDLAEMPFRVPLELSGIELSELMQVYPAEGLAGSGSLSGTVPLRLSEQGVSIESGRVEAVAPGGTLKLPADRLSSMAKGNEAMALVVRAMQNFNYSVLNSTVDYHQDGTLILGLRLEGSSPDVRDGHPIVLNINLEEDIPALLTSLQLSGRVNDAVTEKVRNLVKKREAQNQSSGAGNKQE